MVKTHALVVIAAALGGCVDTSLSGPFQAEVLVRTPDRQYVLQTVALPDLTGFDPSGKGVSMATMPIGARSPADFAVATGITPSSGTTWTDFTTPWGP